MVPRWIGQRGSEPGCSATLFIRTHADGFWGLVLEAPDAVDVTALAQVLIAGNDEVIADGLGPSDPRIIALRVRRSCGQ